MNTNDTNQPETKPEPSQARCAVPICSASEWRAACRGLAAEINTPEDMDGWLVNVNDVANSMPEDIRKHGCAQSPMEMIPRLVDDRDRLRAGLELLRDTTSCTTAQYAIIDELLSPNNILGDTHENLRQP